MKSKFEQAKSPYGDDLAVRVLKRTAIGTAFKHPKKGYCGLRHDSTTPEQQRQLKSIR